MSDFYTKPSVVYDEFELPVTRNCPRCGIPIMIRGEMPSNYNSNAMLHAMRRSPNYREIEVRLSDGSKAYLPICQDCAKEPIDGEKAAAALLLEWADEMRHFGRPESAVQEMLTSKAGLTILPPEEKP